jgi:hypothetical protein
MSVRSFYSHIIYSICGKNDGKRPLERPRILWEDIVKMDLQGVGWGDLDWIVLAQNWD